MKNSIIIIIIAFATSISALAQRSKVKNEPNHDKRPIHFGFSIGGNVMDYQIRNTQFAHDDSVYVGIDGVAPGINIHAIANLRLMEYLDFRVLPGISFGSREMQFINKDNNVFQRFSKQSSYLECPALFKYKAKRVNNFSAFIIGGANFRYDLAVKGSYEADEQLIMMNRFDNYIEIGAGIDCYLEYFKFSIELKFGQGLNNLYSSVDRSGDPPPIKTGDHEVNFDFYNSLIDQIKSQIVVISFHFE